MEKATVDYYVVRIYRKPPADGGEGATLVGLVENQIGEQGRFHTIEELWRFLRQPVK